MEKNLNKESPMILPSEPIKIKNSQKREKKKRKIIYLIIKKILEL